MWRIIMQKSIMMNGHSARIVLTQHVLCYFCGSYLSVWVCRGACPSSCPSHQSDLVWTWWCPSYDLLSSVYRLRPFWSVAVSLSTSCEFIWVTVWFALEREGSKPSQDKMLCCSAAVILIIPILDSELKAPSDSQLPLQPFFFLLTSQYSTVVVFSAVKFRSLRSMIQLLESNPIWNIAAECCSLLSSSNTRRTHQRTVIKGTLSHHFRVKLACFVVKSNRSKIEKNGGTTG